MRFDRRGILFTDGSGWYWPFAKLRYRIRTGRWCTHSIWKPGDHGREDGWTMIDDGRRQMRRCQLCDWCEFR